MKRAHEALQLVELDHLASRRPQQLSGGQQQRVALARAVVNRPALLLLDEPLGALDLKLRRQMQLELKAIQNEVGLTFLHVTHDQEEAMTMADTVAVMNKGRIEQMGAPEELYELPKTAFVANFLGQSNLFTGPVTASDRLDRSSWTSAARSSRCRRRARSATPARSRSACGPRSSCCTPRRPTAQSDVNVLGPGRVTDVSFSGVSTQYQIAIPKVGIVTVFAQNMVFGPVVNLGAEAWVSWNVDHGFGLARRAGARSRSSLDDTDTQAIAAQARHELLAEIEEAASGLRRLRHGRRRRSRRRAAPQPRSRCSCCCPACSTSRCSSSRRSSRSCMTSLQAPVEFGDVGQYQPAFKIENYAAVVEQYWPHFLRAFGYAIAATFFALIISYPLAYFIGVKARRWPLLQALMLTLVIAPFFISFLLRTLAWKQLMSDDTPLVEALKALTIIPPDGHLTGTAFSVIFGLTYNFIPFMTLPIYTSLERLDTRYLEAGSDLYASPATTFWRVTVPLSMPGIVSGTLLTFIPASGDYINASASFLGSAQTQMVGNVIEANFIGLLNYPAAAALSVILMGVILAIVAVYVRASGTEDLV